jgi:hypothetical protein
VEVIQFVAVNEKFEHVVVLTADLQTGLHPIELRSLEEVCRIDLAEEGHFGHGLGGTMFELVNDETFEQLLV